MKDTQAPQECDLMTGDGFIQAVTGAGVTASSFFCNYNRNNRNENCNRYSNENSRNSLAMQEPVYKL